VVVEELCQLQGVLVAFLAYLFPSFRALVAWLLGALPLGEALQAWELRAIPFPLYQVEEVALALGACLVVAFQGASLAFLASQVEEVLHGPWVASREVHRVLALLQVALLQVAWLLGALPLVVRDLLVANLGLLVEEHLLAFRGEVALDLRVVELHTVQLLQPFVGELLFLVASSSLEEVLQHLVQRLPNQLVGLREGPV
jgi:hypothetical protein